MKLVFLGAVFHLKDSNSKNTRKTKIGLNKLPYNVRDKISYNFFQVEDTDTKKGGC